MEFPHYNFMNPTGFLFFMMKTGAGPPA